VWFNRRHRRSGHLFQGRFKAAVVDFDTVGAEPSRLSERIVPNARNALPIS